MSTRGPAGVVSGSAITGLAVAITAGVTAAGAHDQTGASSGGAALSALGRGISVGVPLAVALYACRRPASARFGRVLLVASAMWFLASLSAASSPFLYSLGRLWTWAAEVAFLYAVLAFPSGRLRHRVDRVIVAVGAADALLLIATAPYVTRYPEPSTTSSCYLSCPRNVFMLAGSHPAVIQHRVVVFAQLVAGAVFVTVAVRLVHRIREASPLTRPTLTPVLMAAVGRLIVLVVLLVARLADPASGLAEGAGWAVAFTLPAFALSFLIGLGRWHVFVAAGVRQVNARLRAIPEPDQMRDLLAASFRDPALRIASWCARRRAWIDTSGRPLGPPKPGSGRHLSEVRDGPRRLVAIDHDVALAQDRAFVESAAAAASVAFTTDRVAAQTSGLIAKLKAARAQSAAAGDSERRRIERDLHDGAQQPLVALSIHLELAADKAELEDPAEAAALRALSGEAEQALEHLRSLIRGMHPSSLRDQGLEAAVRRAAGRSPVPATVQATGLQDYPAEITRAVYFCCLEALQNVAKHARGARSVHIELRDAQSALRFSVSDDGPGIGDRGVRIGAGMINMRARMTTVGGTVIVQSRPGQGTRVSGHVPLAALPALDAPPGDRHARRHAASDAPGRARGAMRLSHPR